MPETHSYDYLFSITDKEISAVLYNVGTARDHCVQETDDAAIRSNPTLVFFEQAGLLQTEGYALSEHGKELFEILFIFTDVPAANNRIAEILLRNPVVNLLCQSFYGRGKVGVEQLRVLLNYHSVGSKEIDYSDVVSLLGLLNKYGIAVYDKKNKAFTVKKTSEFPEPVSQYYICPDTPYSNIYNMRKVIRACRGDVYWVDKHFRKEGLELLVDGLPYQGVTSVTIISGRDNLTVSAKTDYFNLQAELAQRQIVLNWRVIDNSTFKWHDRWLVADNQCHNIPPVLAILRGQRAEILSTKERLDVQPFILESTPVT